MTEKWGRRLFKAGGFMLVLLGLVHSLSFFGTPVGANDTERQLLELMANYKFNLVGSSRSMAELMRGFSLTFMLAAICLGTLDLLVHREGTSLLKRVALFNAIWLAAMTAISLRYFFVIPTAFLAVTLLIFAAAWLKLPREQTKLGVLPPNPGEWLCLVPPLPSRSFFSLLPWIWRHSLRSL